MSSSAVQTQGFVDPFTEDYIKYAEDYASNANQYGLGAHGFLSNLGQSLGLGTNDNYDRALVEDNRNYERASISSARAWSEYMDATATQRRVKDLEAAGLNPWLAVQNGVSGSGMPSVDTGGSAQHQTNSKQSKKGLLGSILELFFGS